MGKQRQRGEGTAPGIPLESPLLSETETRRGEKLRAVTCALRRVPETDQRTVLDALFAPHQRRTVGTKKQADEAMHSQAEDRAAARARAIAEQAAIAGAAFDYRQNEIEALRQQYGVTGVEQ